MLTVLSGEASAADPPAAQRELSQYEKESVAIALERLKGEREPNPEGKAVESIEVVPLDMIDDRDPWPNFLNWFHYTTRPYVIRREVLLKEGQIYSASLADETERNLRAEPQFTVALVVPLKGSTPDKVRVLVVTKDVLSLRLNSDPRFYNGRLYYLGLQPSEDNLLGTHHSVSGNLVFTTFNYSVGGSLHFPRIAGSRIDSDVGASVVINCDTGKIEGSNGSFSYGQRLYSSQAKWAWQTYLGWSETIAHGISAVKPICSGGAEDKTHRLIDFDRNRAVAIPYRFTSNYLWGGMYVTRSYGESDKYDISVGAEATRRSSHVHTPAMSEVDFEQIIPDQDGVLDPDGYRTLDFASGRMPSDPEAELAAAVADFSNYLPTRYTTIDPFIQLYAHRFEFQRMLNYWTLGLQEDYQLGHNALIRIYPALKAWGSSRNLFGTVASMGYTWPVRSGFLKAVATSRTEFSSKGKSDASLESAAHFVTPELGFGRFVYDARFTRQYINYLNSNLVLGGTDRLRGYRPGALIGANLVSGNIEFRTVPVQTLSVLIGGALFYDVGDAFTTMNQLKLRDGAGVGLRFGFPQLQTSVLRVDVGFPLLRDDPLGEVTVVAVFGQAVNSP
ncbi:MAG TPA: hypothetical protein VL137_00935 [Polyangiaceae bacterium]|jgi:hypothetical protein|nr:hypothetical protein [Polyangiaceae bacterium]